MSVRLRGRLILLLKFCRVLRTFFSHLRPHAFPAESMWPGHQPYGPRLVGGRRGVGRRLWLPAVAIHRLGIIAIAPAPRHCFRTAHPCAQSVKSSPTEPVLSRSSRQRLGHEPQSAAACRRVERCDCAHETLPRLQSASSWLVVEQLVSVVCRVRSMRKAKVLLM